ncbi:MAG: argininosuccinate lyase [Dehalococcoidales bacterium]|nr:argininosuccinate lyase [Dehalococcoidales bacterium]
MSNLRGRFNKQADLTANAYTASIFFDWRLYPYDIKGSIAHARMLGKQGIISTEETESIVAGLESILKEIEDGTFEFKSELEDIHMNIESALINRIGDAGRKLHTARSRNDQVAVDTRLFTKDAVRDTIDLIKGLQTVLVDVAEQNKNVSLPGYTHMQRAQPVLLAHHLLAYFEMLQRDIERFTACLERVDVLPLGSGALAGVAYDIDREFVAEELGFSRISWNSMDAVSDRDYLIEFEAAASICMMHLSRLAEELALWTTVEFGFIEIDDAYATSSSIMPQKKNPDVAELARGKTGRVYGRLTALLTVMKGLPLAYNSDLQEDKEGFFDCVDTLQATLKVFSGMVGSVKVNAEKMMQAAGEGFILATDLADYLVGKGESFRNAHGIVAELVSYGVENGKTMAMMTLDDYRRFSTLFEEDVKNISVHSSMAARNNPGGTAPARVEKALAEARKKLKSSK